MKVTLEFDLPEMREEYDDTINGGKWHSIVNDMDNYLRNLMKYEGIEEIKVFEVREKLNELILKGVEDGKRAFIGPRSNR